MTDENATLYRGLREVYIDRTTSSYIDGKAGRLYYRGYSSMIWLKIVVLRKLSIWS